MTSATLPAYDPNCFRCGANPPARCSKCKCFGSGLVTYADGSRLCLDCQRRRDHMPPMLHRRPTDAPPGWIGAICGSCAQAFAIKPGESFKRHADLVNEARAGAVCADSASEFAVGYLASYALRLEAELLEVSKRLQDLTEPGA